MGTTVAARCRQDSAMCAGGGYVLSSHPTSEGLAVYVRCRCGGTRLMLHPAAPGAVVPPTRRS